MYAHSDSASLIDKATSKRHRMNTMLARFHLHCHCQLLFLPEPNMEQQIAARKFAIMSVQTKTKCGNKKPVQEQYGCGWGRLLLMLHVMQNSYPLEFNTSIAALKDPTPGKISRFAFPMSSGLVTCTCTHICGNGELSCLQFRLIRNKVKAMVGSSSKQLQIQNNNNTYITDVEAQKMNSISNAAHIPCSIIQKCHLCSKQTTQIHSNTVPTQYFCSCFCFVLLPQFSRVSEL